LSSVLWYFLGRTNTVTSVPSVVNTSDDVDPEVTISVARVYSEGLVLNAATSKLEYDGSEVTTEILGDARLRM
jgi:hypothetical protein